MSLDRRDLTQRNPVDQELRAVIRRGVMGDKRRQLRARAERRELE